MFMSEYWCFRDSLRRCKLCPLVLRTEERSGGRADGRIGGSARAYCSAFQWLFWRRGKRKRTCCVERGFVVVGGIRYVSVVSVRWEIVISWYCCYRRRRLVV